MEHVHSYVRTCTHVRMYVAMYMYIRPYCSASGHYLTDGWIQKALWLNILHIVHTSKGRVAIWISEWGQRGFVQATSHTRAHTPRLIHCYSTTTRRIHIPFTAVRRTPKNEILAGEGKVKVAYRALSQSYIHVASTDNLNMIHSLQLRTKRSLHSTASLKIDINQRKGGRAREKGRTGLRATLSKKYLSSTPLVPA